MLSNGIRINIGFLKPYGVRRSSAPTTDETNPVSEARSWPYFLLAMKSSDFTPALLTVYLRLQHADAGIVPVLLGVVQTVAHHELIRHLETGQIGGNRLFPAGRLIQQRHDGDGGRALGGQVVLQEIQRVAGIQNILHHDDVAAGDVLLQVAGDLHHAGALGAVVVRGDADELDLALDLRRPHQIRHENEAALQHAHKNGILVVETVVQLVAHLPHPLLQLLLRHQNLQDVFLEYSRGIDILGI